MTRVGIYSRISFDDENTGLGVQRQQDDARALAKRLGWQVAQVYVDNNLSAYKRAVVRPAWEQMLADLKAGVIQGIAAYDIDRIARRPHDLERLIDIYDANPGYVFATVSGELNLAAADGRLMARIMVSFANKSSSDTSRRVARVQLQRAQQGGVSGGGRRPYGYQEDQITIHPEQAGVIREAARRTLAGESLMSICRDFDARGIQTAGNSERWNRGVLKRMMTQPRMAGLREYKGALLLGENGEPVKAVWEPILDVQTWEALVQLLTDKSRSPNNGRIDRKYLLSGFLRCHCKAKMFGAFAKGAPEYRCPSDRGCGKSVRKAAPLDAHIEELVLRYLERQELDDGLQVQNDEVTSSLQVQITEAERSLSALVDEWSAGRVSDQVFFSAQARKEAALNALKGQRATEKRRRTMQAPVGAGVRDEWKKMNLSQRRAVLQEVLWQIDVLPKPVTAPKRFEGKYYKVQLRTD